MPGFGKILALTFFLTTSYLLTLSTSTLLSVKRPVFAQQAFTTPPVYEITPGIPVQPTPKGLVYFTKEFDLDYKGGKVMFSSLIDGTGDTVVDDAIQIRVTKSTGGEGVFNHEYHSRCRFLVPDAPRDISSLFTPGINHVRVLLFDICGTYKSSTPLYLVTEEKIAPQPFLDLPWDYKSQGKNLKDLIYNPYSWFDHKYPLQNFCCDPPVLYYKGELKNDKFYKSHSGYDYSSPQGVDKHTLVQAAADGKATFVHKDHSKGAGNMIKIDHGNGYQTWYEHLEEATPGSELIVKEEGLEPKKVTRGQVIGRVGLTGNTTGYHIHLSVFKDINGNGDFNDDRPFGLIDPLGWEGDYPDPWEEYSVTDENKITRHGAKSYKLFTELTPPKIQQIPPSGGTIINDKLTLEIPENASSATLNIKLEDGPFEKASEIIKSIVPSVFLSATNNLGEKITNFNNPLNLIYDYSKADLGNVNEDSMSFYFFNPATNLWEKLLSTLDKNNKKISSQTTHFSQFAVMAELLDSIPPTTATEIIGDKGTSNWYRSNVTVKLIAEDNPGGKGVSYSVYSLDGENWNEYKDVIEFNDAGSHKIYFLSHDNAGNREEIKTIEFSIDKTVPEAKVFIDLDQMDLAVEGIDQNPATTSRQENLETSKKDDAIYTVSDIAGNTLTLDVRDRNKDKKDQFRIHSLKYNQDAPIILEQNQFNVTYNEKKDRLNVKEQNFEVKNKTKVKIQYDLKKNQSTTIAEESGSEKVKEIKNGLTLLWLKTDKGKLDYGY